MKTYFIIAWVVVNIGILTGASYYAWRNKPAPTGPFVRAAISLNLALTLLLLLSRFVKIF